MKRLRDRRVLSLAMDLLFELRIAAQGLGVLLLPGLALLAERLLDLALLGERPKAVGLLGFNRDLLRPLRLFELRLERSQSLIFLH